MKRFRKAVSLLNAALVMAQIKEQQLVEGGLIQSKSSSTDGPEKNESEDNRFFRELGS